MAKAVKRSGSKSTKKSSSSEYAKFMKKAREAKTQAEHDKWEKKALNTINFE